jgi:hypothetical protein
VLDTPILPARITAEKERKKLMFCRNLCLCAAVILLAAGNRQLAAAAQSQSSTTGWACDMPMKDGRTAQQHLDAIFLETAADAKLTATQRASVLAGKIEFDNLCLVDAELGSREASVFADQEGARWLRIGELQAKH